MKNVKIKGKSINVEPQIESKNKDSKSVRESAIKIFIFMNTFGIVSFGDIAHKVYLENLLLRIEI